MQIIGAAVIDAAVRSGAGSVSQEARHRGVMQLFFEEGGQPLWPTKVPSSVIPVRQRLVIPVRQQWWM